MQAALIITCRKCWSYLPNSQLLLVLLFSFAVILGQILPLQAGHSGFGDSELIEICGGEDGSYFIDASQNSEGSEQGHDCSDCSLCTISGNGANGVPAAGSDMVQLSAVVELAFSPEYTVFTDCPEKHWSISRAPPIEYINRFYILHNSFSLNHLHNKNLEDAQTSQVGTSWV